MNHVEAKEALNSGVPVISNGVLYRWINSMNWRVIRDNDGEILGKVIELELSSFTGNSVTIARLNQVEIAK